MIPHSFTGVVITAALINFLVYSLIGYPVIYCLGVYALHPLEPWVMTVRIIVCALAFLSAWWDFSLSAPVRVLGVWLAFEIIARIAAVVFGFGYTCGAPAQHWVPRPHMSRPLTAENRSPDVFAEVFVPLPGRNPWRMSARERGLASRELY